MSALNIQEPNYTQIPNAILDGMSDLSDAELRTVLLIARQTFGWHRTSAILSKSDICTGTGLSGPSVLTATASLVEQGAVKRTNTGSNKPNAFELVVSSLVSNLPTRAPDLVSNLPTSCKVAYQADPPLYKVKENKENTLTLFEMFWKEYPRKVARGKAVTAFGKAIKKTTTEVILKTVKEQKSSDQWRKDDGQWIPHPATWLNQERWLDESPKQQSASEHPQSGKKPWRSVHEDGYAV